jgi:SAM-dependent methyltransferase
MYRQTSADLVARAGIHPGSTVLDLCAGTGTTTAALLEALGPDGRVVAVDGSAAMLEQARRQVTDSRVRWIEARAEQLVEAVQAPVDAIVCNSAIWQTELAATFAGVHAVLRPGGTFVCNVGRMFLVMPFSEADLNRTKPGLMELMSAIAVLDHDYLAPLGARVGGRPLTPDSVMAKLSSSGLDPDEPEVVTYDQTHDQHAAWLRIPIFTERLLPGMPYEQRVAVLDAAVARLDASAPPLPSTWVIFRASRP